MAASAPDLGPQVNTEWLNELGDKMKLAKPRFGIFVHRTPTQEFDLEHAKAQTVEKVMDGNELTEWRFRIEDLAWLKKDKAPGKFASLGIWFNSPEAADWTMENGLFVGRR